MILSKDDMQIHKVCPCVCISDLRLEVSNDSISCEILCPFSISLLKLACIHHKITNIFQKNAANYFKSSDFSMPQ